MQCEDFRLRLKHLKNQLIDFNKAFEVARETRDFSKSKLLKRELDKIKLSLKKEVETAMIVVMKNRIIQWACDFKLGDKRWVESNLYFYEYEGGFSLCNYNINILSEKDIYFPKLLYRIDKTLRLDYLKIANNLKFVQRVGGCVILDKLETAYDTYLPRIVGIHVSLPKFKLAQNLVLPERIGGDLNLPKVESVKGIIMPKEIGGRLILKSLTSIESLELTDDYKGNIILSSLNERDFQAIIAKYPKLKIVRS